MEGLLGGLDPEQLKALMAQFGATEQDRKDANKQAAFALGFGLLQGRKGNELATIGQAGMGAMGARQASLAYSQDMRQKELSAAMSALKTGKELQFQNMLANELGGGGGGGGAVPGPATIPGPSAGAPPMSAGFGASSIQPPGTPAPVPAAPPSPSDLPRWANPRVEILAAAGGHKDIADVIHRQYNLTQGPGGTLLRGSNVVGQVIPNAGMQIDGKFVPLPKEATDALVNFEGAKEGAVQAAKFPYQIDTAVGPGNVPQRGYAAKLYGPPSIAQSGAALPSLPPRFNLQGQSDVGREAMLRDLANPRTEPSGVISGMGPVEQHGATSAIDTQQAGQRGANEDFIKNSYRPVVDGLKAARQANVSLDVLKNLPISQKTGWGVEMRARGAQILEGFGLAPEAAKAYASEAQIFNRELGANVWSLLGQQKGVQSEGDAMRAKKVFANLENTPQANEFMIDMARATNNLNIKQGEFYVKNYKSARDAGDVTALETEWSQKAPSLWDDPAMAKWRGVAQGGAATYQPTPAEAAAELERRRRR